MITPLPRSLDPLPGELLAGYVMRLAHRLDVAPDTVMRRTGLVHYQANTQAVTKAALSLELPGQRMNDFLTATRLTESEATAELTSSPLIDYQHRREQLRDWAMPPDTWREIADRLECRPSPNYVSDDRAPRRHGLHLDAGHPRRDPVRPMPSRSPHRSRAHSDMAARPVHHRALAQAEPSALLPAAKATARRLRRPAQPGHRHETLKRPTRTLTGQLKRSVTRRVTLRDC